MIPLDRIHLKRLKGISEMRRVISKNVSFISGFRDSRRFHSVIPPSRYQYSREKIGYSGNKSGKRPVLQLMM